MKGIFVGFVVLGIVAVLAVLLLLWGLDSNVHVGCIQ